MNRREKILFITIGAAVVCAVAYLLLDSMLLTPSSRLRGRAEELEKKNAEHREEASRQKQHDTRMGRLSEQILRQPRVGDAENELYGQLKLLLHAMEQLGDFRATGALSPSSKPGPGGTTKVTFDVSAQCTLRRAIDLLYLLSRQPYLGRIEELSLTPDQARQGRENRLDLKVRYAVLVQTGQAGGATTAPAMDAETLKELLARADREDYNPIVEKNVFLPYSQMPRPVVAARPPEPPQASFPTGSAPRPQVGTHKLVGGLNAHPDEIGIMDVQTYPPKFKYYRKGDRLPDSSTYVMLDDEARRNPNRPETYSNWRIIVSYQGKLWAVEEKEFLHQRHQIRPEDMPEGLSGTSGQAPAETGGKMQG